MLQDRSQLRRVHLPRTIENLKMFNSAREKEVSGVDRLLYVRQCHDV